jgi:hypothetical protein
MPIPIVDTITVNYQNVINDLIAEDIPGIVLFFNCAEGGVNTCSTTFDALIGTVIENELQ